MPVPVTVPRLGWSMEEGIFAGWLKQDGDPVRPGDALFSLESDKATEEIESLDEGVLRIPPDGPRPGDSVPVGKVLAYLLQPGESLPASTPVPADEPAAGVTAVAAGVAATAPGRPQSRPAISPRALRVAVEEGVDWSRVRGSGKTGRIRERDIRAVLAQDAAAESGSALAPVVLSPTRRVIAERMLQSARSTVPVTLTTQADASRLVELRTRYRAEEAAGTAPGYTDFLVKLAAVALQRHPYLNARWEGGGLLTVPQVHIGIAVDTEAGLLVPVLRDVQDLGPRELATRCRDLIARARSRKLVAEEMQGGTFTVTSLGAYGVDSFTPVINHPEVAILGVGAVRRQPVVRGEAVVPGDVVTLSLTFDHRALDGAPAARFLQTLCELVEEPGPCIGP